MLSEILDRQPMESLLCGGEGVFCPEAGDPAWDTANPAFRQEIASLAAVYREKPYPMRTAMNFLAFVRSGSRRADEDPYFLRRRKLCVSALAVCCGDESFLEDVLDGVWCICEETSWVISAHNVNPIPGAPAAAEYPLPDPEAPYIDLFAAQTGMILSLILRMLGKRLEQISPVIPGRIREEIRRRILTPFMKNDDFWWMGFRRKDLNNWTPWILSNILVCGCLAPLARKRFAALLDRAFRMLDRWLDVMPEDGGCDEGAGYWNMAGGAMLDCLQILENLTGERLTLWDNEKIRNILCFPLRAEVGNGWFVNFADCDARPFLSGERLQFAGEKLGNPALEAMGRRLRGTISDQLNDVPHLTRVLSLLFHPAGETMAAEEREDTWLKDLQLRLVRRGDWTLCCKGGHNGENHNHNDVGSFMLYLQGEPVIVDAGNMVYTAKTFSDQRYTLWNVRSAYHNVPLIGDREQLPGTAYAAREVVCLPDGLALEMAGAYGNAAIRIYRSLRVTAEGLTLEDDIRLPEPQRVSWVFLFRNAVTGGEGWLEDARVRLMFPPGMTCETEEIPIEDSRMARNYPGSLRRVKVTDGEATERKVRFVLIRK